MVTNKKGGFYKMKKLWMFVMAIALMAFLAACSSDENGSSDNDSSVAGDSNATSNETYVVKVGYENNPGEPFDLAVQKWAELAKERSNGQLIIEPYASSQLGSKSDLIEQMRAGANVVTLADGAFFRDLVPDMEILMAPYLVENEEQMFELFKTDWYLDLESQLRDKGLHILTSNWLYGVRHVIADKPATTPEEFKGMKLRTPTANIMVKTAEGLGATPTPMPLGDVYPSMAQGVINGMENPLPVIQGSKVYEQAKHIILTGHITNVTQLVGGEQFMASLPADILTILKETGDEAGNYMTELVNELDKEIRADLEAEGVTFHEVDREVFKEAAMPIYTSIDDWTPGLYETVQDLIK